MFIISYNTDILTWDISQLCVRWDGGVEEMIKHLTISCQEEPQLTESWVCRPGRETSPGRGSGWYKVLPTNNCLPEQEIWRR